MELSRPKSGRWVVLRPTPGSTVVAQVRRPFFAIACSAYTKRFWDAEMLALSRKIYYVYIYIDASENGSCDHQKCGGLENPMETSLSQMMRQKITRLLPPLQNLFQRQRELSSLVQHQAIKALLDEAWKDLKRWKWQVKNWILWFTCISWSGIVLNFSDFLSGSEDTWDILACAGSEDRVTESRIPRRMLMPKEPSLGCSVIKGLVNQVELGGSWLVLFWKRKFPNKWLIKSYIYIYVNV